jgi:hypothetical protein
MEPVVYYHEHKTSAGFVPVPDKYITSFILKSHFNIIFLI